MDHTTRRAAFWATLVAVPSALLVVFFTMWQLSPDTNAAAPQNTPTAADRPSATSPVTMPAPQLAERPATVCRALLSRLPATLGELTRRPVATGPEQNAAYGDPPLTVACGVPPVDPGRDAWVVNGVCWRAVEHTETVELTTIDREVPVRVSVPRDYQPPLQWLAPLADSVLTSVKSIDQPPSGCRG